MKKFTRGFTLIELLVVIAIIGILASIVLVSLNGARKKGADARVISDVQEIRTALETGYTGSYYQDIYNGANTNCNSAASVLNATYTNCVNQAGMDAGNINTLVNDASSQSGLILISVNGVNNNSNAVTSYAIRGQLVSSNTTYFCIDSSGKSNALDNNADNASGPGGVGCH